MTRWWLSIVAMLLMTAPVQAASLRVAAAPSAREPLEVLAAQFEHATRIHVTFSFASSGKIFAQLQQGAPYDVYFSADADYPARLHEQGLSEAPRRYARGRLVVWAPRDSRWHVERGLRVLASESVRKVAIANPQVAPYGRAAVEALRAEQLYEEISPKLVIGEDVAQAAQFVETGSADLAILPLSLATSPELAPRGKYALIPADRHAPLDAAAVVLKASPVHALAERFLSYCTSARARPVWRRFGLSD